MYRPANSSNTAVGPLPTVVRRGVVSNILKEKVRDDWKNSCEDDSKRATP